MKTLYIVPIEPIDQRYTKQWYENIPRLVSNRVKQPWRGQTNMVTIEGRQPSLGTTTGAFLDFGVTNIYKASQVQDIAARFSRGEVKAGDKFLVTDAWNFAVTAIRYMSELMEIPVEIHGIWHAGAYDPTDILGMKMGKRWSSNQERAWYYACDYNYFATDFHKDMFLENLAIDYTESHRAIRSGQPHEPIIAQLSAYQDQEKHPMVMWPHRYNADKQPEIAEDLNNDVNVLITQKLNLSKADYYKTMGGAAAIFSCALHENLGISVMEGCLAGAIPIVPDRASYAEMYLPEFKYPSEWTSSKENYFKHKTELVAFINDRVNNRGRYLEALKVQQQILIDNYLNANIMIDKILENT
jgi:hypothetical protein